MNYQETIHWLYQQLPMFQRQGKEAYKENLDNITAFCEYLGNPQNQFKSIHVAGTNGKGSTSHMLTSILQEAYYKTGLHTSPHLKDFRERAKINGEMVSEKFIVDFVAKHKDFIVELKASFFEVNVALAFQFFAENDVDIAVIETGLGGRLDSTNIIKPELSIITNVGLDHTAILGETIQDIAIEKSGIIKYKTPVVIGESTPITRKIFTQKAEEQQSIIYFADDTKIPNLPTDLKGTYQKLNKRTVLTVTDILIINGLLISNRDIKKGLKNVTKNTGLRGRWDILQKNPLIVADTAHNADGIKYITQQIKNTPHQQLHLVLGFVNDKDIKSIIDLFPKDAQYYFCEPNVPRKKPITELKQEISTELNAQYFDTVEQALTQAKQDAQPKDFIYIGGSTFVVAEVI